MSPTRPIPACYRRRPCTHVGAPGRAPSRCGRPTISRPTSRPVRALTAQAAADGAQLVVLPGVLLVPRPRRGRQAGDRRGHRTATGPIMTHASRARDPARRVDRRRRHARADRRRSRSARTTRRSWSIRAARSPRAIARSTCSTSISRAAPCSASPTRPRPATSSWSCDDRGREGRPLDLLRRAVPRAVPRARQGPRRRGPARAGRVHRAHRRGALAPAAARARGRGSGVGRRAPRSGAGTTRSARATATRWSSIRGARSSPSAPRATAS